MYWGPFVSYEVSINVGKYVCVYVLSLLIWAFHLVVHMSGLGMSCTLVLSVISSVLNIHMHFVCPLNRGRMPSQGGFVRSSFVRNSLRYSQRHPPNKRAHSSTKRNTKTRGVDLIRDGNSVTFTTDSPTVTIHRLATRFSC